MIVTYAEVGKGNNGCISSCRLSPCQSTAGGTGSRTVRGSKKSIIIIMMDSRTRRKSEGGCRAWGRCKGWSAVNGSTAPLRKVLWPLCTLMAKNPQHPKTKPSRAPPGALQKASSAVDYGQVGTRQQAQPGRITHVAFLFLKSILCLCLRRRWLASREPLKKKSYTARHILDKVPNTPDESSRPAVAHQKRLLAHKPSRTRLPSTLRPAILPSHSHHRHQHHCDCTCH